VKHLVAAHNGVTRVESVIRQGSTFYFTLPVEEKEMPHAEEPATPAETLRR
jgi:signal transduction histidine kinase